MAKIEPDFARFHAAISRRRLPDRVPNGEAVVDFEIMEAFLGRPLAGLADYAEFWPTAGYDYAVLSVRGQPLGDSFQKRIAEGVLYRQEDAESAGTFSGGISDQQSFEAYPWIEPEGLYYRDVDEIEEHLAGGMKLIVNVGPLFSGIWRCMGLQNFAIACMEQPDLVGRIAEKMGELMVTIAANAAERPYVGAIWLGDDMAYTSGLMVRPEFLRRHVFPFYRRIGDLCRQYDKLFVFHSDGKLLEVFEDLLACGIQAINPNEPASVDIVQLKADWGSRVALIGNVDVDLLSRGTPDEVTAAVKHLIETVGPGGGYAVSSGNSVAHYTSMANYRALLDAVRLYGAIY